MHAHAQQLVRRPGDAENGGPGVRPDRAVPGLTGAMSLQQLGGPAAVYITMWDSAAAARAAGLGDPPTAQRSGGYEVTAAERGSAAGTVPTYARILYFDGPRAPEQVAAEDRAGRERLWPATRHVEGLVGLYVLRAPDSGAVIITLATSVDSIEAVQRAVLSTQLLPGEDPALLGGPDGVELHQVAEYQMPATESVPGVEGLRS
jgi:hypothetical protein